MFIRVTAEPGLWYMWKIIYLVFEKSQRSVTYDSLRYINSLTYLHTYRYKYGPSLLPALWRGTHLQTTFETWHCHHILFRVRLKTLLFSSY